MSGTIRICNAEIARQNKTKQNLKYLINRRVAVNIIIFSFVPYI